MLLETRSYTLSSNINALSLFEQLQHLNGTGISGLFTSLMSELKEFLFEPQVFPQFRIGSALISSSKYTIFSSVYDG